MIAVLAPRETTRFLHAANVSFLEEPWRRGFAGCDAWPEDPRIGVAEALHLQAALVAAMRGDSTSLRGTGPLSAVAVVALVEDLLDLLISPDDAEPPFARGAAVHGPADLGLVRCQIRESRLAHVPVAWRFIVMAISASVLLNDHWDLDHPFERLLVDTAVATLDRATGEFLWATPTITP